MPGPRRAGLPDSLPGDCRTALVLAVLGFIAPGKAGRVLAALALFCAIPALVLYSASLAVFALVLAGLRLVRAPRAA